MKYQLTRYQPTGGRGFGPVQTCVVSIADGAPVPPGGTPVPDDTPLSDWADQEL